MFLKTLLTGLGVAATLTVSGFSQQFYETPYDLIRPVWPTVWDSSVFSQFTPGPRNNSLPTSLTPQAYTPNEIIPDTLNQVYWDAMNVKMSPIRLNQAGYLPQDPEKLIYYIGNATSFEVVDLNNNVVGTGSFSSAGAPGISSSWDIIAGINAQRNNNIRYTVTANGPSGDLQKGFLPAGLPEDERLRVKVGTEYSATFIISERVYSMIRAAGLKFLGTNRSGTSESWFHPASHTKDGGGPIVGGTASYSPVEGALQGGWYDCGDHLKESQTQAYTMAVLAVMAASDPERDEDLYAYNHNETVSTDGIPDLLREAKHGADFVLAAYDLANGVIDEMAVSVGNFGADHGWWGRPEYQDLLPLSVTGRGGPHERDVRLGELGSNISGQMAATLAIVGKMYAKYDATYAAKALKVAEEMYDFAKNLAVGNGTYGSGRPFVNNTAPSAWSSAAYNGNNEHHDDLGLAAIALLYATADTTYLYDAVENPALSKGQTKASFINNNGGRGAFRGGWFTADQPTLWKATKNTSWANIYSFTLYGFYKMILQTQDKAAAYGIDNARRLQYIEDVVFTMAANLGSVSKSGGGVITLPVGAIGWAQHQAGFDPIWFSMHTDQTWIYNRYQAGNIFEVMAYADVTKDLEGVALPNISNPDWKSQEMWQLGINQMNYMLGLNPWDFSMMIGVGDKNDAHPHHRAANPEGKNVPGAPYSYRPPTGVLYGGIAPSTSSNTITPSSLSWEDYHISETCIDAAATYLAPATILARAEDINRAPKADVQIKYVGFDSAIVVVRQDVYGSTTLNYGTSETNLSQSLASSGDATEHTFILKPLDNGTTYYFTATSTNKISGNSSVRYLVDSTLTPYTFTTLNSPPAAAEIQNIEICNISADSAEIMWYTPNGEYESKIYWDTVLTSYDRMANSKSGDEAGVPTKFHYMKIGGLKEKTTYYYAVESNGVVKAVDDEGQPLKFTTPVTQYDFEIRTYEYNVGGLQFVNFNIFNNEGRSFDSLEVRIYVNASEAQMSNCQTMFDSDICQAYDEAGFNKPCENDTELRGLLRGAKPRKLDDTYDPATGTYDWYIPLPLGSTTIKSSSRLRLDVRFSGGIGNKQADGTLKCDPMVTPAAKTFSAAEDWSWMPHSTLTGDPVNYSGMPKEDKEFGDADMAPVNPYLAVYRKDEFVWGYSPSYNEMKTKRANYKISVDFEKPFNVSNGSYVELDQASSTVRVKGTASITEGGVIKSIWVNGKELESLTGVATFDPTSDKWNLDIPAKLTIGANKVDVTVFAGSPIECDECETSGGCAFENRNFFIQFSKGDRTASTLRIETPEAKPVNSPAVPGQTSFNVVVIDKDNLGSGSVFAYVINPRKKDTLKVTLAETASGEFKSSTPIAAVNKSPSTRGANEISFFGGDTLIIRYIDIDDEEDISEQSIYAEAAYPKPVSAVLKSNECSGKIDLLEVTFSNTFGPKDVFDSAYISISNIEGTVTDSFKVMVSQTIENKDVLTFDLSGRTTLPVTAAPTGTFTAFLMAENETEMAVEILDLTDGIPPRLAEIGILESFEAPTGRIDTMRLGFTEPVTLSASSFFLDLTDENGDPISNSISLLSTKTKGSTGSVWEILVNNNTVIPVDAPSKIYGQANDQVQISDFSTLRNSVNQCPDQAKLIRFIPQPVPISDARIIDQDGNGFADSVVYIYERKLRPIDIPDSIEVEWGYPKAKTYYYDHAAWDFNSVDSTTVVIKLAGDYKMPFGNTAGVGGQGSGMLHARVGGDIIGSRSSAVLKDFVPPVVSSAIYKPLGYYDGLTVNYSEPLDLKVVDPILLMTKKRGRSTVEQEFGNYTKQEWLNEDIYNATSFTYDTTATGYVTLLDSVRMPYLDSGLVDKAGNVPTNANPFVVIKGQGRTPSYAINVKYVERLNSISTEEAAEMKEIYTSPESYQERFVLKVKDLSTGNWYLGGGQGSIDINPASAPDEVPFFGPTLELTFNDIPSIGGVDELGYPRDGADANGNPYVVINVKLGFTIYDHLGQFVNRVETPTFTIDNPDWINSSNQIVFYLEWLPDPNKGGPRSADGRIIGTGSYIGSVEAKMRLEDKTPDEDGVERVRTGKKDYENKSYFGFKRF